eukprot:jgi/Mesvir1/4948/Mv24221-RA.1
MMKTCLNVRTNGNFRMHKRAPSAIQQPIYNALCDPCLECRIMSSKQSDLVPPEKPEPGECCGSGCKVCVWDLYYGQLEEYEKALALREQAGQSSSPAKPGGDIKDSPNVKESKEQVEATGAADSKQ